MATKKTTPTKSVKKSVLSSKAKPRLNRGMSKASRTAVRRGEQITGKKFQH